MPQPPFAPRVPSIRQLHGQTDADDYSWMRDHEQAQFRDYLAAERDYYEACAARLTDLAGRLAGESAYRIPAQAEFGVSWPLSGFMYRIGRPEGRENLQFLRSKPGESSEQVLIDENIVGAGSDYVEIADLVPSPDGDLLAWTVDLTGAEICQLRIRDLRTGADLPDLIERTYQGLAWSADSRYVWYLVPDEVNRPFQVWRHQLGTAAEADELIYEETDARFEITLRGSRSGRFGIVESASRDTTEVRLLPLADPLAEPVLVKPRRRGVEYHVDHARPKGTTRPGALAGGEDPGWLFIVTDEGAPEFTLMRARPDGSAMTAVKCAAIAPARPGTRLHGCDVVGEHLVLSLRRDGAPLLAITGHDGGNLTEVRPGLAAGSIRIEHAHDYDAGSVIIVEESLIEPPAWYRLVLATGERELLKRRMVAGYEPARYRTEQVAAVARDGTAIPVTLAYLAGTPLDGTAPCLLYGYGAYEACSDPEFAVGLPSLLDRGVVYAIAHVRGGGEGGRSWWQQGRLTRKPTTFTDFIDVADWLAGAGGLVDGRRIVSRGLSAGGLLQGAVYSMRPDRWAAVVAEVPFVDCVTTMLDPSIPLTINEWDEWGDPRDPEDYACIRSYSPYDNPPPAGARPRLLVTGAVHDPRVAVHEPAKWVARLRATGDGEPALLFRVELGAGAHTGPSGRYAKVRYEAEVHAFVLDAMGLTG